MELKNILPINGPSAEEVKKYIDKYNDESIVIKCGGSVLLDPNLFDIFIEDVAVLKKIGLSPIIVHGGGPRIKKKLLELNIESTFIKGLRVTDNKIINIEVVEKPTGEIYAGAGTGTSGSTLSFGLKENNYIGKGLKVNSNLSLSEDSISGIISVNNPNFNNSDLNFFGLP